MDIIIISAIKSIINTGYLFIFLISLVNVLKHGISYYFDVIAQPDPNQYLLGQKEKIYLMISIALVFTCIFTGFKIV